MRNITEILGLLIQGWQMELTNGWAVVNPLAPGMRHPVPFDVAETMLAESHIYLAGFRDGGSVAFYHISSEGRDAFRNTATPPSPLVLGILGVVAMSLLILLLLRLAALLFAKPAP